MTYMSLLVEIFPADASDEDLEKAGTGSETALKLDNWERLCAPHQLAAWAKSRGLRVHYIDNCWVRVPITTADFEAFKDEVLGGREKRSLPSLSASGGESVIVAEEF